MMSRAFLLFPALVLAPMTTSCGGDELSTVDLPVCAEGCVQGACSEGYFGQPPAPFTGSHFPVLRELDSPACEPSENDEQGRAVEYLCFGAARTRVTYQGDTGFPATIVQTNAIQAGTVEERLEFEMEWTAGGTLTLERLRSFHNGDWTGTELSYVTILADDEAVAETHALSRFEEDDGPGESGNHAQSFFTDQRVERAHTTQFWSADGRMLREELRAGADEVLARETDYAWSERGLESLTTTSLVEDDTDAQNGCTKPDPNHIRCTAELRYDDDGTLISFVEAGTEYAVSDNCCGACVAE
jgi:hypothetical protein